MSAVGGAPSASSGEGRSAFVLSHSIPPPATSTAPRPQRRRDQLCDAPLRNDHHDGVALLRLHGAPCPCVRPAVHHPVRLCRPVGAHPALPARPARPRTVWPLRLPSAATPAGRCAAVAAARAEADHLHGGAAADDDVGRDRDLPREASPRRRRAVGAPARPTSSTPQRRFVGPSRAAPPPRPGDQRGHQRGVQAGAVRDGRPRRLPAYRPVRVVLLAGAPAAAAGWPDFRRHLHGPPRRYVWRAVVCQQPLPPRARRRRVARGHRAAREHEEGALALRGTAHRAAPHARRAPLPRRDSTSASSSAGSTTSARARATSRRGRSSGWRAKQC